MRKPVLLLTGGGTAGHVSVNEALIPIFEARGYEVHYIGSTDGIEKEIIGNRFPHITYHPIQSGKLRRYFSMKNFTDPFRVGVGLLQAIKVIRKIKPELIFSKGGFVSVPVGFAGQLTKVPVVIHESDVTPGLANKLAVPFATHVFTVFEQTLNYLPKDKSTCSGAVVRPELFEGIVEEGRHITGFKGEKPVLLVTGGSQGAKILNDAVRNEIQTLTQTFDIIHLCGKGNADASLAGVPGYQQYEYVTIELSHLLAMTDYAVSRAGSNAIFELVALKKPMLLVPLSRENSRGDQILNANFFKSLGLANVIEEEQLHETKLSIVLDQLQQDKDTLLANIEQNERPKTAEEMAKLILQYQK